MATVFYSFADYRLVPSTRELWRAGQLLPMQRLVFDCVAYLVTHHERAVGRDELVAAIWGRTEASEGQVHQLLMRVRRVFSDDPAMRDAVRTVPGFGYRWTIAVEMPDSDVVSQPMLEDASVKSLTNDGPHAAIDAHSAVEVNRLWRRSPLTIVATVLAILAMALLARWPIRSSETMFAPDRPLSGSVAVLPLDVSAPEGTGWIRLGAMDLIAARLRGIGLPVASSESVLLAAHGLGAPTTRSDRLRLRDALGAEIAVTGTATVVASGWNVELTATTTDASVHRVRAESHDVIDAARRAADLLAAALGRAPPTRDETTGTTERNQQIEAALLAGEVANARALIAAAPESERASPALQILEARVDIRAGRFQPAESALTALLSDPTLTGDHLMSARALTLRGTVHGRRGEHADAARDFGDALSRLGSDAPPDEKARALSGLGMARLGLHHFDDAALNFGEARHEYIQAGDALGLAQSDANLGLLEAERGRLEAALPYLQGAAERFESLGAVERQLAVMIPLFDAQVLLLRWSEALRTADRQISLRAHAVDPALDIQIALNRCTALAGLGHMEEAAQLLEEARARLPKGDTPATRFLAEFEAPWYLHQGRFDDAARAAAAALADRSVDLEDSRQASLVLTRQRALMAGGHPFEPALPSDLDPTVTPAPARLLAMAESAAADERNDEADDWFRRAYQASESVGLPGEVTMTAQSYARWLIQRHRIGEAAALAGRISAWADRDFDSAVLQVEVAQAQHRSDTWGAALRQAQTLAGDRPIAASLLAAASP